MGSWDSWLARDLHSRSDRSSKAVPVAMGAGGAEDARLCEPGLPETRQGPAATSSCERLHPAAAAGLPAAGTSNEHREGWFDPMNSQENALGKREGCEQE